jgi:hypothetical protein
LAFRLGVVAHLGVGLQLFGSIFDPSGFVDRGALRNCGAHLIVKNKFGAHLKPFLILTFVFLMLVPPLLCLQASP